MKFYFLIIVQWGFPGGTVGKNLPTSAGDARDMGLISGWERSTGEGNGNPPKYSCLGKSHGQRSLVGYSPWGCKESNMTEHTHTHIHTYTIIVQHSKGSQFIDIQDMRYLAQGK